MLALALATALASAPTQTVTLSAQLDVGAMVGSGWFVPQTREQMQRAINIARDGLLGAQVTRFDPVLNSTPVVGAWVMATEARGYDQAMLITSGALQLMGVLVTLKRLLLDENGFARPVGPQLTFSPIVGGQLGLSVRLTNF